MERTRRRVLSVSEFISQIQTTLIRVGRVFEAGGSDIREQCTYEINAALTNLSRVEPLVDDTNALREYREKLQRIVQYIENVNTAASDGRGYSAPTVSAGHPGRPCYDIPKEQLEYFLNLNFCVPAIAKLLNVHKDTVHSRMRKYGLSVKATYSDISDDVLDDRVKEIIEYNKNIGFRMLRARLDSEGIKVTYQRVRASMARVDTPHIPLRFGNAVTRRVYNVAGPNALWHIDGNHKLIQWGFVVHGCVDGYSRLITFMKVATNNRSDTVKKNFLEAVAQYGLPSRIRTDKGGENAGIVAYMIQQRGRGRGSSIIGPSVHNQRIERTWVDLFQGSLCVFHDLFSRLVATNALDLTDQTQKFAFQYTFLPIIQRSIDRFVRTFNSHPIRTENSKSPEQLFISGMLSNVDQPSNSGAAAYINRVADNNTADNGAANDGPIPPEVANLTSVVNVQDQLCPYPELEDELKASINPLEMCDHDVALDVYRSVLQFFRDRGH